MKTCIYSIIPKIIFVLILIFPVSLHCLAQSEAETFTARNALYVEFGGNSGRYAVNYGRIIHQKEKLKLNVSAGFSMWRHGTRRSDYWLPVVPMEILAFWGRSNHHLEIGTGVTSILEPSPTTDPVTSEIDDQIVYSAAVIFRVGYRYQKPEGGFFFRAGYTPYFYFAGKADGNPTFQSILGGASFGWSF